MKLLLILVLSLLGFSAQATVAQEAYAKLVEGKAIFVDVREPSELRGGMIQGALSFPLSQIESDVPAFLTALSAAAADKEIYIYCRSGARAGRVIHYLVEANVTAVNLGGFEALVREGLPATF